MEFLYDDNPIVACSSGNTSNCAIAVIRFSGFNNLNIFSKFLSIPVAKIKPRKAHFCDLIHEDQLIDQVVAVFFKGPNSYNGENVLELSVHGNVLNVDRILDLFINNAGFRLAYPGEFSYRALKNKKLNLSQVEGLDLLLNANSNFSLQQGFSLMSGSLQKSYLDLHEKYLNHRSSVELSIDFLEDIGEQEGNRQLFESFSNLMKSINKLCDRIKGDSAKLLNPEIVLVGQPNSGKSTFFNALLGEERSIVTNIAGTTRDFISERVHLEGVNFRLIDTAGIRNSEDAIEMEGVKRALDLVANSFLKVLLVNPFEFNAKYFEILNGIQFDHIFITHSDLTGYELAIKNLLETESFLVLLSNSNLVESANSPYDKGFGHGQKVTGPMGAEKAGPVGAEKTGPMGAEKAGPMGAEKASPMEGKNSNFNGLDISKEFDISSYNLIGDVQFCSLKIGLDNVVSILSQQASRKYSNAVSEEPILLKRHKQKIFEIAKEVDQYGQLLEEESDISIISSELNNIGHCISELIGIVSPDDVLHNIFDNFCIGK
ncbi:MAG: hypothetical protein CMJ16_10460 [Peredibacter sp.]|nr:hypothetical protein [Peredibacter sp.]